jgi:maltooligosyltrehalose trehalohydrolase
LVDPAQARLAAAVLLLTPGVPLLFMGEEYAETAPFPYFVDHSDPELLEAVRRGRAEEFGRDVDTLDPAAAATFEQGLLDWRRREAPEGKAALGLYQALLAARRAHPVITDPTPREHAAHLTGELLIVHRRSREQSMLAAFNFAAGPASLPLAEGLQWQQVLDGESLDAGAPLDQGALTLPAYGFALCVAAHEGTETLR